MQSIVLIVLDGENKTSLKVFNWYFSIHREVDITKLKIVRKTRRFQFADFQTLECKLNVKNILSARLTFC